MEWSKETQKVYDDFTAQVPEMYREMVRAMMHDMAEKKCNERNDGIVNMSDLITGLFDCIPKAFESGAIDVLQKMNIDVSFYKKELDIRKNQMRTWDDITAAFHPGNYHFTMYLTDRCNQNCKHCAASQKVKRPELSKEQWIDIIENVEGSLQKDGRHGVYIWFGGEPTTRSDLKEIMQYCADKDYFQAIATNGILFDEEFAQFCEDIKISHVFISLDSTIPEKADAIRGAKGAYDNAVRAIKTAIKHGLFVIVTATVMKQNIDELKELQDLITGWGAMPYFRAIIKQRSACDNWDEIGLDPEDYKKFYDFKYGLTIENIRKGNIGALPVFAVYDMVPFMEVPKSREEFTAIEWGIGCQACRTISGIDINGDVFPCDYPSNLKLGNVLKESFYDIMQKQVFKDIRDRKRTGKCGDCKHIELCGGGCRVHAECETGDFFASFSQCWCEDMK